MLMERQCVLWDRSVINKPMCAESGTQSIPHSWCESAASHLELLLGVLPGLSPGLELFFTESELRPWHSHPGQCWSPCPWRVLKDL